MISLLPSTLARICGGRGPLRALALKLGLRLSLGLGLALAAATAWAHAEGGHSHDAPAAPAAPALPRAVASSDLFELVAVLEGRQLTVFVDRAATNEPLRDAQLDIDLAGRKLALQRVGEGAGAAAGVADATAGDFVATLDQDLPGGVHPLTATVTAGGDIDLLAGELTVAAAEPAHGHGGPWAEWLAHSPLGAGGWAGALALAGALFGALALGAALAAGVLTARARSRQRLARSGGVGVST